jgi:hypothetical protein
VVKDGNASSSRQAPEHSAEIERQCKRSLHLANFEISLSDFL